MPCAKAGLRRSCGGRGWWFSVQRANIESGMEVGGADGIRSSNWFRCVRRGFEMVASGTGDGNHRARLDGRAVHPDHRDQFVG